MASRPISPAEPSKKHPSSVQPNAHPYAIKTTTSALLSRSNSSPHYANHTRHHYVPTSTTPSRVTAGMKVRHRHSSSVSLVEGVAHDGVRITPLPAPPSMVTASSDYPLESSRDVDEPKLTHRVRRAETLPSTAIEPITEHRNYDQKCKYNYDRDSRLVLDAGLPPNPKQWDTDELATYLETSLSLKSSWDTVRAGKDDTAIVGILDYIRTCGLTGRELLRLTDGDLVGTPLSDVQRAQLLERSRTLRADVLRNRIYVDSYHAREVSDNSNDVYTLPERPSTPFHGLRGASMSVDDLRLLPDNAGEGAFALPPSPAVSLHRSNSVSDASNQRYRDLARMRMRRRGRVKGLVETWERANTSGSEFSASEEGSVSGSEAESESEIDTQSGSILDTHRLVNSSLELPSAVQDAPCGDVRFPRVDSMVVSQEPASLTPPPPYTHVCATHEVARDEEEPSIEELLASSSSISLKGARAWEADFGLGETVKRIPVSASVDTNNPLPSAMEPKTSSDGQLPRGDSVRSKRSGVRVSTGSGSARMKTKAQKRIVTAIFTGSPDENAGDEVHFVDPQRRVSGANGVVHRETPENLDLQDDSDSTLQALEESIAATRAQVQAFRVRLEQVETDTARQEAQLQYSDIPLSGFESRQRRSEAGVQAIGEIANLPREETLVTGGQGWETMSLRDITSAIVAKAMGWLFPYGRLGVLTRDNQDRSRARHNSCSGANDKYPSVAKRGGSLPLARMSCSFILVSFAICAAMLRRMGLGKWVRTP